MRVDLATRGGFDARPAHEGRRDRAEPLARPTRVDAEEVGAVDSSTEVRTGLVAGTEVPEGGAAVPVRRRADEIGRLIPGLVVALALIAGIGYTRYVGAVGSDQFVHPTGNADCRTPLVRYGWTYEAINYDIANDAILRSANPDMENCSSQGAGAGAEVVTGDGVRIAAGRYVPAANGAGPTGPTVVLAHGWGANKSEVLKYAARSAGSARARRGRRHGRLHALGRRRGSIPDTGRNRGHRGAPEGSPGRPQRPLVHPGRRRVRRRPRRPSTADPPVRARAARPRYGEGIPGRPRAALRDLVPGPVADGPRRPAPDQRGRLLTNPTPAVPLAPSGAGVIRRRERADARARSGSPAQGLGTLTAAAAHAMNWAWVMPVPKKA